MTSDELKSKLGGYQDLVVWQKAVALVKQVYQVTKTFPSDERFGLISQMRRAAVSIPSNIAEGQARHTRQEFIQFISHAEGSLAELDTHVIISRELGYCAASAANEIIALVSELKKMLNALRRALVAKRPI